MAKTRYSWEDASTNSGYYVGSAGSVAGKITEWNRTTVADGKWLNRSTIKPFSGRDEYLLHVVNDLYNAKQKNLTTANEGTGIKIISADQTEDVNIGVNAVDTYNIGYVTETDEDHPGKKLGFQLSANISAHTISADNSTDSSITGFNLFSGISGKFDYSVIDDLEVTNLTVVNLSAYNTSAVNISAVSSISADPANNINSFITGFNTIQGSTGYYTDLTAANLTATDAKITNISGTSLTSTIDNIITAEKVVETYSGTWVSAIKITGNGDTKYTPNNHVITLPSANNSIYGNVKFNVDNNAITGLNGSAIRALPQYEDTDLGKVLQVYKTTDELTTAGWQEVATNSYYNYAIHANSQVEQPDGGNVALGFSTADGASFAWGTPVVKYKDTEYGVAMPGYARYSSIAFKGSASNGSIAIKGSSADHKSIAIKGSTADNGGIACKGSSATYKSLAIDYSTAYMDSVAINSSYATLNGIALGHASAMNGAFAIHYGAASDGAIAINTNTTPSAASAAYGGIAIGKGVSAKLNGLAIGFSNSTTTEKQGSIIADNMGAVAMGCALDDGHILSTHLGTLAIGNAQNSANIKALTLGSIAGGYAFDNANIVSTAPGSIAIGHATLSGTLAANGNGSIAGGYAHNNGKIEALGNGSIAYGVSPNSSIPVLAHGDGAVAFGTATSALANGANAEGLQTFANAVGTHAEGNSSSATGKHSHAENVQTLAAGIGTHAEGYKTSAFGQYTHAEGYKTYAYHDIYGAHAEGEETTASGQDSHAEGAVTKATGFASHSEGWKTSATSYCSHAAGILTLAQCRAQTVVGKYNALTAKADGGVNDETLFVVGNGTSDTDRSNAISITTGADLVFDGYRYNNYKSGIIGYGQTRQGKEIKWPFINESNTGAAYIGFTYYDTLKLDNSTTAGTARTSDGIGGWFYFGGMDSKTTAVDCYSHDSNGFGVIAKAFSASDIYLSGTKLKNPYVNGTTLYL